MNFRSLCLILVTFVWTIVGIFSLFVDPTGHLYIYLARFWGRQVIWISGMKLEVLGAENIEKGKHYVVCANHSSQLDIPLLFYSLPFPIRFLAKQSLFYIPVFGWSLYLARFIAVDRGRGKKAVKLVQQAAQKLKKGPSLVVFPEGTRTSDGRIDKFKSGGFGLAIKSSVSLLPVAIRGTYEMVPKNRLDTRPGDVTIVIGKPISTEELTPKDTIRLAKKAQGIIEKMFEDLIPV